MKKLYTPGRIEFGEGAFSKCTPNATVVTSPTVYEVHTEAVNRIDSDPIILSRSSSTHEPVEKDILTLVDMLKERKTERVVAVGGGSVIDSTKIALLFLDNPELRFLDLYSHGPRYPRKTTLISVETTSGTGTGISAAAVVIKPDGLKVGLVGPSLIGDGAIYDPELVYTMPKNVVAHSGMDALTHAIEAYTSRIDNIAADTMALKAVEIIGSSIMDSYNGSEEARAMMHYANMMAAIGFANSRLGICHAIAHKVGGRFGVEHGRINAILLPYVVAFNMPYAEERFNAIARVLGFSNAMEILDYIMDLNRRMKIPTDLSYLGERFERMIPVLAAETEIDGLMKTNPREADAETIEKLLHAVYTGDITEVP